MTLSQAKTKLTNFLDRVAGDEYTAISYSIREGFPLRKTVYFDVLIEHVGEGLELEYRMMVENNKISYQTNDNSYLEVEKPIDLLRSLFADAWSREYSNF
jgi:hypothetical protein